MSEEPRTDGGTERTDGGTAELPAAEAHGEEHHLPPLSSVKRWFVTTNHKDIGILYLATSIFFLLFGGSLALLFRLELLTSGADILSESAYNQAVSIHGLIMVFWFLSPVAFGFANYVVPLQIGAKDLAFPRLNAFSYWSYLFSGILMMVSFFQGGSFNGGWTMYAPLNTPTFMPQIGGTTAILGLTLFVISVTVSSVNFLTTMHRMRAEGLKLRHLPVFSSSILLTTWMMLFAFAALLAALMILSADHLLGTVYFAADSPGGSLLWTHLFWFFGHPEVYIVFFPALGIMAETFQTFSGRRLVGRKWFVLAMLVVALQSFVVWMHHMFLTSINLNVKTIFMATTIGISLPFDLMMFALIYTLVKGRVRFTTPFLFNFGAVILFIVGGITGVFLGAVVLDYEFRGTYWVVAHFHYVMVGGATALFGGLYYWWPKITGKMYDEFLGKVHFAAYFVGFNLLYFPMFIAWEMPRRVFVFDPAITIWNQIATVGAYVLGLSFLIMFYNFYVSLRSGADAGDNPWKYGSTAEWAISSPPDLENFPGIPSYAGGQLSFRDEGAAATDGGTATAEDALAGEEEHADHASIWPFGISLTLFVLFLGLAGLEQGSWSSPTYMWITALGLVGAAVAFVAFGRERFRAPEEPIAERWPFEGVDKVKTGVWIFMASDVILFGAFIGSYIFVRVSAGWTGWEPLPENVIPGLMNTYILLTSSFAVVLALVSAEHENRTGVVTSLLVTFLLGIGFLVNKAIEWEHLFHEGHWVDTGIRESTFFLTTGLHAAHVIIGLLIAGWLIVRAWNGAYLGEEESRPVEYFGIYWHFVDIVWLFLFPLFYIL